MEPTASTGNMATEELIGRNLLAFVFTLWALAEGIRFFLVLYAGTASPLLLSGHCLRIAVSFALCYAIWIGQVWARRLTVAWCAATFAVLVWYLATNPTLVAILFTPCFLTVGLVLAFSKRVTAFMRYQRAQRPPWSPAARLKAKLACSIVFVVGLSAVASLYIRARNQWPYSFQQRLIQLKADQLPTTLAECDRDYAKLEPTPAAVAHFQKAFAAISAGDPPLMRRDGPVENRPRQDSLPRFSDMATMPEEREAVQAYLKNNAEALQLLHDGSNYGRVTFPIRLTDGFQALLPHLHQGRRAAHLLALEAVQNAYSGDATNAAGSIMACLHMAEVLMNDPTLVGIPARDRILSTGCEALRTCLNLTAFRTEDLERISGQLEHLTTAADAQTRIALMTERCLFLSLFQGSNREIADFLQQPQKASWTICCAVEFERAAGILQRDAAFFLDCLDRMEAANESQSRETMLTELRAITSDVEANTRLVGIDKKKVNVISCMSLPGTVRAMEGHIWNGTLADATLICLAVERYRQETGHLPDDSRALLTRYLKSVSHDPFLGKPIHYERTQKGYVIASPAPDLDFESMKDHPEKKTKLQKNWVWLAIDR